ncbi:MAG TPA: hypothetical protein DCZ94_17070 [Lentisphaeria bacterium]|nr:MAG: hypothetical protein A2X48_21110 [Lentisphaerae bacterium GWF2_49_21]HBC88659.1 hypothetical protein [Lentisphaeria bacterium]
MKQKLQKNISVGGKNIDLSNLPYGMVADGELGLLLASNEMSGKVIHENPYAGIYETRATVTPKGDYLLMFPDALPGTVRQSGKNGHYAASKTKTNNLIAYRSSDKGKSWKGPSMPLNIDYNMHSFIPLIPRNSQRIYAFGTQPRWDKFNGVENAAIGFRYSDDDGFTWSDVTFIEPVNDSDFQAMSAMRMCETDRGTWILGAHAGTPFFKQEDGSMTTCTRQYLIRSEDKGKTWTVLPDKRPNGWFAEGFNRMDEGRPINIGNGEVYFMSRTCEGHLWSSRSLDDGKTWSKLAPTPLVHPDAPPMLFHLGDGKTLAAFHHNSHTGSHFNDNAMRDRGQLWISLSRDGGMTWSKPRFVLSNIVAPDGTGAWCEDNCSYIDLFSDNGVLNIFMPHRWRRCLHIQMEESAIEMLPDNL